MKPANLAHPRATGSGESLQRIDAGGGGDDDAMTPNPEHWP